MNKPDAGNAGMNPTEWRAAYSLAGVYALRMLGFFMIVPVFALYAAGLEGVNNAFLGPLVRDPNSYTAQQVAEYTKQIFFDAVVRK